MHDVRECARKYPKSEQSLKKQKSPSTINKSFLISAMSSTTAGPHILAYPYPDSGHIIPLLDLIHRLLARGLKVTVLINPDNLPLLHPLLSIHPSSIQPLVLSDPEVHDPPRKTRVAKVRAMSELYYPILLQWFRSPPSPCSYYLRLLPRLDPPPRLRARRATSRLLAFRCLWLLGSFICVARPAQTN
jgi:hypothetical protein